MRDRIRFKKYVIREHNGGRPAGEGTKTE